MRHVVSPGDFLDRDYPTNYAEQYNIDNSGEEEARISGLENEGKRNKHEPEQLGLYQSIVRGNEPGCPAHPHSRKMMIGRKGMVYVTHTQSGWFSHTVAW